ncbi:unnamed protein product [Moneuplotes crassus]|uniref:Uncharacterized protein n=1 Tax=Euplotes crassus TaxID=5936 RepID=A0AAD1UKW5_EUPCR|nr:unnamed protein product [Moneuplotes crassus]
MKKIKRSIRKVMKRNKEIKLCDSFQKNGKGYNRSLCENKSLPKIPVSSYHVRTDSNQEKFSPLIKYNSSFVKKECSMDRSLSENLLLSRDGINCSKNSSGSQRHMKNQLSLELPMQSKDILSSHPYMNSCQANNENKELRLPLGGGGCAKQMYKFKSKLFESFRSHNSLTSNNKRLIKSRSYEKKRFLSQRLLSKKSSSRKTRRPGKPKSRKRREADLSNSIYIIKQGEEKSVYTPNVKGKKRVRFYTKKTLKNIESVCNVEIMRMKISISQRR